MRLVLVPLLAAAVLACAKGGDTTPAAAAATPSDTGRAAERTTAGFDTALLQAADLGRIKGDPAATLWMLEVSDFECPYCRRFHAETWGALDTKFVRPGRMKVAYLNLPLPSHRHAWVTAEAAMCASVQKKFWPMHDSLFASQPRWSAIEKPDSMLRRFAVAVGVDTVAWGRCMTTHATRPLIQADIDRVTAAGVQSTPTFFIGDTAIAGAYPLADFDRAITTQLARKAAGTTKK